MKFRYVLLLIGLLALLVSGCETEVGEKIVDGVEEKIDNIQEAIEVVEDEDTEEEIVEDREDIERSSEEKEILETIEEGKETEEYSYSLIKDVSIYDAYVKGNLIKLVYNDGIKVGQERLYNEVYLDTQKETAHGICRVTRYCEYNKVIYELDFDEYFPEITPVSLLYEIENDWRRTSSVRENNHQSSVLEFVNNDGNLVQAYISDSTGLVVKWVVYDGESKNTKLETYDFNQLGVKLIESEEVEIPSIFSLE